ncbi:MAG: enoyl-CoA hydratase-related protein [Pseudomonadota bacterium]
MTIKYEKKGERIALITLNRPEALNALDGALRKDFADALRKASGDKEIWAIVVTGEGRGFCAGGDIRDFAAEGTAEDKLNVEYSASLTVIRTCEKPVIAAVNGPAAGIGMTLALSCDLSVMSEEAYMMCAFSNIGMVPDGGLSLLMTQYLGYVRAFQLAIEAEKIDAARALEWGLVNRVVPATDVVTNAISWAETIVERAPIAIALTKRAFRNASQERVMNISAFEAYLQSVASRTEDCREGAFAKLQKRKPIFKGQ